MLLSRIESLTDSATITRGRDYLRRGRVLRVTARDNGSVEGVVEGDNAYRVRIHQKRHGVLVWSCTCPAAADGSFCKHCVAVALAAEPGATDAATPDSDTAGDSAPVAHASTEILAQTRSRILAHFRTRRDLVRWSAVSEYVSVAYLGVRDVRAAAAAWGPAALIPTVQKALASVDTLLGRADDSNGEIGEIAYELLALHAELCAAAPPKPTALVAWLISASSDSGFLEPDVADYAEALGARGLQLYGERLDVLEAELPAPAQNGDYARTRIAVQRQRLAVAVGDPAGVIASFGDLTRSYRMHDLAKALVEVAAVDEAIAYAERATLNETGWQAESAGKYWCDLLHENRPRAEELEARRVVFERWPTSRNALALAETAGADWEPMSEAVFAALEAGHPRELINTLLSLGLDERAWNAADRLTTDVGLWTALVAAREKSDPDVVVPVLIRLIDADLEVSNPRNYMSAVKRLKQLRRALKATDDLARFPLIVDELREQHRRRPRLLDELRRAGF